MGEASTSAEAAVVTSMTGPGSGPLSTHSNLVKDDLYYLDFVQFEVEETLTRIPRYHFTDPPKSRENPSYSEDPEEEIFQLQGITLGDFHQLLMVLYPLSQAKITRTWENWVSVLYLSTGYQLRKIRQLAIDKLEGYKIPCIKRIILAQQYGLPDWLLEEYLSLVKRGDSITVEEAQELGLPTTIKLFQIREAALKFLSIKPIPTTSNPHSYSSPEQPKIKVQVDGYRQKIEAVFDREFSATNLVITDTIERILLARSLGIVQWLRYSYVELANRFQGLTESEAERIGLEAAVGVYQVRESMYLAERSKEWSGKVVVSEEEYVRMIGEKFELDIGELDRDGAVYSGLAESHATIVVEEQQTFSNPGKSSQTKTVGVPLDPYAGLSQKKIKKLKRKEAREARG